MATLPDATTRVSAEASPLAGGTGYCVVFAAVSKNADAKPRVFSSWKAVLDMHDYAPGVDYAAHHTTDTKNALIFVPLPIAVPGTAGRINASGVTGSSVITVTPGPSGYLEESTGVVRVTSGGTIGTDDIRIEVSLDGEITTKAVRLNKATSYTFPYVGIVVNFGAGTLAAGDVFRFATTAPRWDSDGIADGRTQLGQQLKPSRTWMIVGDLASDTEAGWITNAINSYETDKKRFAIARAQVRDRLPFAEMSRTKVRVSGTPTITFAEVGGTGDTITRSSGSFITDGFAAGMIVKVTGSASNNVTGAIATVTASTLTLDTTDLVDEGPVSNVAIEASAGLTFAEVGATGDTITRSAGSWLADGFRAGDVVTVLGTASNNVTGAVTTVTASVLTFGSTDLAAEVIASDVVTITAGEAMSAWVSSMDDEFSSVDAQKRINLGLGRLRKASPITGWQTRRPVQWSASLREYQHDVHHPTWQKDDGPLDGWALTDADGSVVEYAEDVTGGALAARFTCARTWSNGPEGAFIAMDLTRAEEGSVLQYQHNMAVANVACTIVQSDTENFVGRTPPLKLDGTMTSAAREVFEEAVNTDLEQALLREFRPGEGPRASFARWQASSSDVLNVVDATMTGAADLRVNGTVVHVNTLVKVS